MVGIQVPDIAPNRAEKPFLKKVLVTELLPIQASAFWARIAKAMPSEYVRWNILKLTH